MVCESLRAHKPRPVIPEVPAHHKYGLCPLRRNARASKDDRPVSVPLAPLQMPGPPSPFEARALRGALAPQGDGGEKPQRAFAQRYCARPVVVAAISLAAWWMAARMRT